MSLIPKVMSTQHPDNASPAPFADSAGVLRGDGEIEEVVSVLEIKPIRPDKMGGCSRTVSSRECLDALRR